MTQILVTLNEDATTLHVRKAIELLRGVVSTTVFKTKDESNKKTLRQQAYVKESLERAFDEMKQARREGRKLQSADDFIKEMVPDPIVPVVSEGGGRQLYRYQAAFELFP